MNILRTFAIAIVSCCAFFVSSIDYVKSAEPIGSLSNQTELPPNNNSNNSNQQNQEVVEKSNQRSSNSSNSIPSNNNSQSIPNWSNTDNSDTGTSFGPSLNCGSQLFAKSQGIVSGQVNWTVGFVVNLNNPCHTPVITKQENLSCQQQRTAALQFLINSSKFKEVPSPKVVNEYLNAICKSS
ncbi:MAG: hypothetical protein ACRCXZ_10005 [Patescibacteria group bacterium]